MKNLPGAGRRRRGRWLALDPSVPPFVFFPSDSFFCFVFSLCNLCWSLFPFSLCLSLRLALSLSLCIFCLRLLILLYSVPCFFFFFLFCSVCIFVVLWYSLLVPVFALFMFSGSSPLCLLPLFSSVRPCSGLVCWRRWRLLWNGAVFPLKWLFAICPPEVLLFSNWTLIHGKFCFVFNFAPRSIAIGPLDFSSIYKKVLSSELCNSVLN